MSRQRRVYVLLNRTQFMFAPSLDLHMSDAVHFAPNGTQFYWRAKRHLSDHRFVFLLQTHRVVISTMRWLRCARKSKPKVQISRWIPSRVLIKLNRFSARRDANDWSNVNAHVRQIGTHVPANNGENNGKLRPLDHHRSQCFRLNKPINSMERNNFICATHIISMRPAIDMGKLNSVGYTFIIISSLPIVRLSHSLQLQFENNWKPETLPLKSEPKARRKPQQQQKNCSQFRQMCGTNQRQIGRVSVCIGNYSRVRYCLSIWTVFSLSFHHLLDQHRSLRQFRTFQHITKILCFSLLSLSLSLPSLALSLPLTSVYPIFFFVIFIAFAVLCRKFIIVFVLAWLTCRMAFAVSFCRHIAVDLLRTACAVVEIFLNHHRFFLSETSLLSICFTLSFSIHFECQCGGSNSMRSNHCCDVI